MNNDITYADVFKLPRLAFGAFTNVLRKIINSELSIEPNIIYYGKPTFNTFDFVGNPLMLIERENCEVQV